jgi:hypothetical protein
VLRARSKERRARAGRRELTGEGAHRPGCGRVTKLAVAPPARAPAAPRWGRTSLAGPTTRSRCGRAGELHRGGAGLLLDTFAEVLLGNAVLRLHRAPMCAIRTCVCRPNRGPGRFPSGRPPEVPVRAPRRRKQAAASRPFHKPGAGCTACPRCWRSRRTAISSSYPIEPMPTSGCICNSAPTTDTHAIPAALPSPARAVVLAGRTPRCRSSSRASGEPDNRCALSNEKGWADPVRPVGPSNPVCDRRVLFLIRQHADAGQPVASRRGGC